MISTYVVSQRWSSNLLVRTFSGGDATEGLAWAPSHCILQRLFHTEQNISGIFKIKHTSQKQIRDVYNFHTTCTGGGGGGEGGAEKNKISDIQVNIKNLF